MTLLYNLYHKRSIRMSEIADIDTSVLPQDIIDTASARQIVWHLYHKIHTIPKCNHPDCNNDTKWQRSYYGKFCSKKCSSSDPNTINKTKSTILSRYGDYESFIKKGSEKRKKTNLERYGSENPWGNSEVRKKITETNLKKYGVENAGGSVESQSKSRNTKKQKYDNEFYTNQEKAIQTNLKKYGCSYPSQNDDIKKKTKQTFIDKYDGFFHNSELISTKTKKSKKQKYNDETYSNRAKAEKTNIEKYGVKNVMDCNNIKNKHKNKMNLQETKDRRSNTMVEKYGVKNIQYHHINHNNIPILTDKDKFVSYCNNKKILDIASSLGVNTSTVYNKIIAFNCKDKINIIKDHSSFELQLAVFLDSNNIKYIKNDRQSIKPYEIDFYIPSMNLGIECNGDYWHSDIFKDRHYHYQKWKACNDANIHLISIGEADWHNKKEIFQNLLKSKFSKITNTYGARKCTIKKVNMSDVKNLFDTHHLQGHATGTHSYAAYNHDNLLVGAMIFGWTRGSKENRRFELKRWVTIPNTNFPGLFSKVFKYAQRDIGFKRVISFSDNRWFTGDVYNKNNFNYIKTHNPNYFYVLNGFAFHKQQFMKSNIKKKFPHLAEAIDNGMTESQATKELGALKIWDSGKIEWEWICDDNKS